MQISLRQALRLRTQVEAKLKSFSVKSQVVIDIDDERLLVRQEADLVKALEDDLLAELEQHERLNNILANLRVDIAAENVRNGVEKALADAAAIDRRIRIIGLVLAEAERTNVSIERRIERKREALKNPQQSHPHSYGRNSNQDTTIAVGALSEAKREQLEKELFALKRKKVATEDGRNMINASSTIEIADDDLSFLESVGIV